MALQFNRLPVEEMHAASERLLAHWSRRRSVREFSTESVPLEVIRRCIAAAGTAPSGANKQPWTFCLVTDPELKRQIRHAAEAEERLNYGGRMSADWLADLAPLHTDASKPHIEEAPALVAVFRRPFECGPDGQKQPNYYVNESVGIAVGMLIAALHEAGLATLPHTPSPMDFLGQILHRPTNERAFLLMPIGYPAIGAQVPAIERKNWAELCVEFH